MSTATDTTSAAAPLAADELSILISVDRAVAISEEELRYQLAKRRHPLADRAELLDLVADLEDRGLLRSSLYFKLTPEGRRHGCASHPPDANYPRT